MDLLIESLQTEWHDVVRLLPRLGVALVVFTLFAAVGRAAGHAVAAILERGNLTRTHKGFFRRLVAWILTILGVAAALDILGLSGVAAGIVAGGGLAAVVLGFAFRQIGENFLAGFLLAFSRPFDVDDVIESGELKGRVAGIELRHTHIRTEDGRDIFIPNAQIFNNPLVNYTRDGLLRSSFTVGIDYADDADEACRHLRRVVARIEGVLANPEPSVTIRGLQPAWVELQVAFWADLFAEGAQVQALRSAVIDACRRALRESGYTLSNDCVSAIGIGPEPLRLEVSRSRRRAGASGHEQA